MSRIPDEAGMLQSISRAHRNRMFADPASVVHATLPHVIRLAHVR